MSRSGYTLPVFACASAMAALQWLKQRQPIRSVLVDLIVPAQTVEIPIEQVAGLRENEALAITLSDPGDNLDLTRNTPVWALVTWQTETTGEQEQIIIQGGEGIGRIVDADGKAAIYTYAQKLLRENLTPLLAPTEKIQVTIILPEGRQLADRTSSAAFGIVEGLSLLGTSGISQPLSSAGHLETTLADLREKIKLVSTGKTASVPLVFCVGENGLSLAQKLGIPTEQLVKTANWFGPMLVEAGMQGVKEILLFGYHGKLLKLAGGIFHTHHYLADGRLEILTAFAAKVGLPIAVLQEIFASKTAEDALQYLQELDAKSEIDRVNLVYLAIAQAIDDRSQAYIRTHSQQTVCVGSILFDRDRQIIVKSQNGSQLLEKLHFSPKITVSP